MTDLLNPQIFGIIENTTSVVISYSSRFIALSLGIASILIMIVIAQEGYKLMVGDKSFDPIWWIRPLVMLLIITTWQTGGGRWVTEKRDFTVNGKTLGQLPVRVYEYGSLPTMVRTTFGPLEGMARETFAIRMAKLEESKKEKLRLLDEKWNELLNKGAEIEAGKEALDKTGNEEDESWLSSIDPSTWGESFKKEFASVKESIVNYTKVVLLQISSWVDKIIEWIGNLIWAIAVYATFMTKSLAIAFLTIFGPISFGLSVYDLWRDAWATWLMRFISFHLYGWVAYIVMTASCSIIDFGVRADIALLSQPGFPEAFSFNAIYTLFGYLVGAMAMKMVPEVVSWIVPTNASQAAGQFSSGLSGKTIGWGQAAAGAAVSLTSMAITKGKSAGGKTSSPSSSGSPKPSIGGAGTPSSSSGNGNSSSGKASSNSSSSK